MGLEAPLALLGLLGVLVPLLVHRMRKRELPRVRLPTFALLSKAVAKSQQKQAFTDLWLLLLRIAVVVSAALALAVPYATRFLSFGDGRLSNVVIVIDDSLSMARVSAGTSLIERARARAIEVAQSLPEGSELSVVLAGKPARVLLPLGRDLATAQSTLRDAELPAVRENDLTHALELAMRQQNHGLLTPHRVLVLSDFARHVSFERKALSANAIVSFERIGTAPEKPNLYIAAAQASVDPAAPSETSISVEIRAAMSDLPAQPVDARAEVEVQGKRVHSQAVTLERGAAQARLRIPSPQPGQTLEARVRIIADDALEADNQVSIVLGHGDSLQLLLVNGDPRPATRADELFYASRALSLLSAGPLAMRIQTVDPLSFGHARLSDSDVIVLANVSSPGAELADALVDFVRDGGGLIIAAGSRLDPSAYNARLEALLPGHLRGAAPCADLRFAAGDAPGFLPEGLSGLREVRSQQRLLLDLSPQAETLLRYEDGAPALTARSIGDGRTLLMSTSLDTDFSDLPLRPGYLPLLAAAIRDAAGATAAARGRVMPGDSVVLPTPRAGRYVEVRGPTGQTWRYSATRPGERIRFTETVTLGVFEIWSGRDGDTEGGRLRATFVVEPPRDESDVSEGPLPTSEGQSDAADNAAPVSVHAPFSPWLWLLVFALVVAEGTLRARRRWASVPSASPH